MVLRPREHRFRHPRQPCHVDAVAAARRPLDDPVQKDDAAVFLRHIHRQVAQAPDLSLQRRQLVIVRGEERADVRPLVAQKLHGRPRDGQAVIRARPPPDLVEDDQAPRPRRVEDVGELLHLHEEGGLPLREIVRGPDAREDAVDHPDARPLAGHETPRLGHQHDERRLPHVGGFSRHVRPRDQKHARIVRIEPGIVADEHPLPRHLLDDRMPALVDFKLRGLVDHRLHIPQPLADLRERAEHIQCGDRLRSRLQRREMLPDLLPEGAEKVVLHLVDLRLGVQDQILHLLQLRRDVPLRIGQRLLADVVVRHLVQKGLRHLEIVAEDPVVPDLQIADARPLPLAPLQIRDPHLAVLDGILERVQLRRIAGPDETPFPDDEGRVVHDGTSDLLAHILQRIDRRLYLA